MTSDNDNISRGIDPREAVPQDQPASTIEEDKYPGCKNDDRADWAQVAVDAFAEECNESDEPTEQLIRDLLTDLCHLCDRKGLDITKMFQLSFDMYEQETTYDPEDPDNREEDCGPKCELDEEGQLNKSDS